MTTVKMMRDEPLHPGGPIEADVHPNEVNNWQAYGWRVADRDEVADTAPLPEIPQGQPQRKKPGRPRKSA